MHLEQINLENLMTKQCRRSFRFYNLSLTESDQPKFSTQSKKRESTKMKLISAFCAVAMGKRMSLIAGVEQGLCNGTDMCGDGHASTCMRITQEAIDYFGKRVGKIGSERCSCIFQVH